MGSSNGIVKLIKIVNGAVTATLKSSNLVAE